MDRRSAMLDFLQEDEPERRSDDSEIEQENISMSDHDSESEQSMESLEDEQTSDRASLFFFGRGMLPSKSRVPVTTGENLMWRKTPYKASKTKRKNIIKFKTGLTSKSNDVTSELSAFQKIISPKMIEELVRSTNKQIQSKGAYSRDRDAQVTSISEMMALLGILYLIGLKKNAHTNVIELWDNDGTGIPLLSALMSYRRFLFLLRHMRFDDKTSRPDRQKTDKIAAIRSINDQFIENCKASYTPGEYMTIDEMLHAFRGRCSFIQYMPKKPARYGLKIQAMCDAKSFYTYNLELYCGKQQDGPYNVSNKPADVVQRLVDPIKYSNRNITMDNWYTSLSLANYLLSIGLTCLGTVRKNKKEVPKEFLPNKSRKRDSSVFGFQKDGMLVSYVPKQNRAVILLSTMHDQPDIDESSRKPMIILDYNDSKGGVDMVDQMCAAYSVSRITRMWTQAYFYVLLNIAGINAQVIFFAKPGSECVSRRVFLKNLAMSLIKEHVQVRARIPTLPRETKQLLRRMVTVEEEEPALPGRTKGRCKLCRNSTTTIRCSSCKRFICKKHLSMVATCESCVSFTTSDDD